MEPRIIMTNLPKWQRKETAILLYMKFQISARTSITSSLTIVSLALQVPNNASFWTLPWSSNSNQTESKINTKPTALVHHHNKSHNQTYKYKTITIRIQQSTITLQMLNNIIISIKLISIWDLTAKRPNHQRMKMGNVKRIKLKIKIKRCSSWFNSLPIIRIIIRILSTIIKVRVQLSQSIFF